MILDTGKIGNLQLKNRCVMPPMATNLADVAGNVTDEMIAYYRRRAQGGFGLIIIEITAVDPRGKALPREVGLWKDEQIAGFRRLIDAIHEAGSKVFVQLHHAGRQTTSAAIGGMTPEGPSKVACPLLDVVPEAMSIERIWEVIEAFGDAAVRAKTAGADGVEVHGAHGYLIAQFMSGHANKRTDAFGGDFFGRMKFPLEVFRNIRSKVGADFPVTFRFSYDEKVTGGRCLEESVMIARLAEQSGVDALHVSIMTYESLQYMCATPELPPGFNQFQTKAIKEAVHIPVISVGRYTPLMGESALLNGCADFIAFGREALADPDLPKKTEAGRMDEVIPCIGCTQSCIDAVFKGKSLSCLVNPETGHEWELLKKPAKRKKNLLVIGGGPAGLEAALFATKRGHHVTLCEKEKELGGQFRLAAVPPAKHEIAAAIKYWIGACEKHGVQLECGTEATAAYIKQKAPDAVILATGSKPALPRIPGISGGRVVTAEAVLRGDAVTGKQVLVLGGGMVGVETAEFLADHHRSVTVVEQNEEIAMNEAQIPRAFLLPRLERKGVAAITGAKVMSVLADGVLYTKQGKTERLGHFDTMVLAFGPQSYNPLEKELKNLRIPAYVIGDAKKTGTASEATEDAFWTVLAME